MRLRAASLPDPETHNLAVGRIHAIDVVSQRGAVGQNRPGSLPQLRRMSRFCNNWMCLRRAVDFAANATSTITRKNNNNKSAHNYKFSAPRDLGLVQSSTSTTTAHVKSLLLIRFQKPRPRNLTGQVAFFAERSESNTLK